MTTFERFPGALDLITAGDTAEVLRLGVERGWISDKTALLIATHNHDDSALEAALKTSALYIGMLGSKKKVILFSERMKKAGYSGKDLNRVHAPRRA